MKEPNYPMPLQSIFCIISCNTLRAELFPDSVLLSLNCDIAKRAKRAKNFGRLTQKSICSHYEQKEKKKKKNSRSCRPYQ